MQSSNPVFGRAAAFNGRSAAYEAPAPSAERLEEMYAAPSATPTQTGRMTYDDVVMRTGATLGVLVAFAVVGWWQPQLFFVGFIGGLVLGLVNAFKKEPSPPLILAYAALQGLFVGGISWMFESMSFEQGGSNLQGIVAQAVMGTVGVFAVSLFLYRSGRVRVTPKFQRGAMMALGGYLVFVVFNLFAQIFGFADGTFGFRSGWLGVAIGLFAVTLAAVMLIMDFDFIEKGVQQGIPSKYAWTAAFGLTVTLVWLYIEMLRLLAILRGE
ncbi:Bax inhibitor-1/YccA family protein [Phytoactinopolyspora halotolerans]|uniref:Bax inhibitor-1/YccA family protein n=1 Tax=Phytoactinopolyspora halotolerans TaxID=1981512 RepID=A0A6L9S2V7_9ACTN|nr:Bax inhibitor-1/YccA family protein [Phytoactinopolyspora halotolerans]NED99784.1 Bax inhibitor-1/YccA family protein [Phytoactinopolyspora halotolerans]